MHRPLIIIGLACLAVGLFWPWLRHLPLGRLPGDIVIVREKTRLYFPITTSLVISAVASLLLWLMRK